MNTNHLKGKIGGAILAISLLFGIGMASSTTAQAQYRNDQYGQYRRNQDWQRNRGQDNRDRDDRYRFRDQGRYPFSDQYDDEMN